MLVPALIHGGKLQTWDRKCNALGRQPLSQDEEDILRMYETAKYEMVRVKITLKESSHRGRVVRGCTSRFAGEEYERNYMCAGRLTWPIVAHLGM
jgi:hypothetical protein